MFTRILVPLDGSDFAESVLPLALGVAERADAQVRLVTVQDPDPQLDRWTPVPTDWHRTYLDGIAASLQEGAERVTTHVLSGYVTEALEAEAATWKADLAVLASHGRGAFSRAWLGSVADGFVRHAACPVLVVRSREPEESPPAEPPVGVGRVLVPLDGSPLSESILDYAVGLGSLFGAGYHLVRIVPFPRVPTSSYIPHAAQINREAVAEAEEEAVAYVSAQEDRLRERGLEVTSSVTVVAQPARGILAEALERSCDLIAMATHGRGGLRRAVLGSTADKVLRATDGSVLLYRPPDA